MFSAYPRLLLVLLYLSMVFGLVLVVNSKVEGKVEGLDVVGSFVCYADYYVSPFYAYVFNGSTYYTKFRVVEDPVRVSLYTVRSVSGTYVSANASLVLTPASGVGRVDAVVGYLEDRFVGGSVRRIDVEASVLVPRGSLGFLVEGGLVEGDVRVYAFRLNSSLFEVVLELGNYSIYYELPVEGDFLVSLTGLSGAFEGNGSLRVSFLVDARGGRAYLVDGGDLVPIGEKLPFFAYPEAFDPRTVMEAMYNNTVAWLIAAAESPPVDLVSLARKVEEAVNVSVKMSLISDYVNSLFTNYIAPRFTYLGSTCRASLGVDSIGWVCDLEINVTGYPSMLVLTDYLPSYLDSEDMEASLEESIKVETMPREEPVNSIQGFFVETSGLKILRAPSLVIPLPRDNPLGASLVEVIAPSKIFECQELVVALRSLGLGGDPREIAEAYDLELYEKEGERVVRVLDKASGRLVAEVPIGDIPGTDAILFLGDRHVMELQSRAEQAWARWGPTLANFEKELWSLLNKVVTDATAKEGSIDLDEALKGLRGLWSKYIEPVEPVVEIYEASPVGNASNRSPATAANNASGSVGDAGYPSGQERNIPNIAARIVYAVLAAMLASSLGFYIYKTRARGS